MPDSTPMQHSSDEDITQLLASEERFRTLFWQEQRRARHLSLINEVQKCALATRDIETFLPQVTRAIGSHFKDCDVTFYLSAQARYDLLGGLPAPGALAPLWDGEAGEMVAVATSGEHGLGAMAGTRRPVWELAEQGSHAPFHPEAESHLSVPFMVEGENSGLIVVQSRESEVLDARDVAALHTAAAIIASHLQNSRLFRNMSEINDFNQSLLNSMLHSLMVIDRDGTIQFVNERLLQTFGRSRDSLKKQNLETVFGEGPSRHHQLRQSFIDIIESGEPREVPEVHVWSPEGTLIFDLRGFRVFFRGQAEAAILLINLTQRWRKTYQLQLMHEIGRLFQESLAVDRVLSTILTCITAGNALGFNRAFVFLFDESKNMLEGRMALGPSSADEASRIWSEITQHELTLPELLRNVDDQRRPTTPLQQRTMSLRLNRDNQCFPALQKALKTSSSVLARHNEMIDCDNAPPGEKEEAWRVGELLNAAEIAIAPLVAKDRLIGVVFADNLYSGSPIEMDDIQLLDTLAQQAGLALDNAATYEDLQKAQKELVSAERLVAVGEMAARVSHEIRNPLATIGGFARSVLKRPEDLSSVKRKTQVIVDEVVRLEELLTDLLDMARPRPLDFKEQSANELAEHALLLAEADLRANRAEVIKELTPDLPPIEVDRSRLLQALLNTIRNGAQAMPEGGTLAVSTRLITDPETSEPMMEIAVRDTGVGISERALRQIFDPFFSTKVSGSGLGLAVTKRIINEHGGRIDIQSKEGEGTTFAFVLPLHAPPVVPTSQTNQKSD